MTHLRLRGWIGRPNQAVILAMALASPGVLAQTAGQTPGVVVTNPPALANLSAPVTTTAVSTNPSSLASAAASSTSTTNGAPVPEDAAAMKFVQTCAGCHTYGGGKLTGPDLITAATWPKPDLKTNIKRMEQKVGPLADEVIEPLANFLKDPAVKTRIQAAEAVIAEKYAAKLEPGSLMVGHDLFYGVRPLQNRGLACSACHSVEGAAGMLGLDLRGVHAKMGETALISAIEKANFKIMDAAFRLKPVTRQEALHLAKYFGSLKAPVTAVPTVTAGVPILSAGGVLATLGLAGMAVFYRQRRHGPSKPPQRRRK